MKDIVNIFEVCIVFEFYIVDIGHTYTNVIDIVDLSSQKVTTLRMKCLFMYLPRHYIGLKNGIQEWYTVCSFN